MRDVSVEDLIGAPKRRPGRPPKVETPVEEFDPHFKLDLIDVYRGVTVTWLMNAFHMDRNTVRRKLAKLKPIRMERNNAPAYDFKEAVSCLIKPRFDIKEYLRSAKATDLPVELQKDYWDARIKEQKYLIAAGDLWRTEDVLETFGEAFKHIKTSVQLFMSAVERNSQLTKEQRNAIESMTDDMLKDLHGRLVGMQKQSRTPSYAEKFDAEPEVEENDLV